MDTTAKHIGIVDAEHDQSLSAFGANRRDRTYMARVMEYKNGEADGRCIAGTGGHPSKADALASLLFHCGQLGMNATDGSTECFWILKARN